MAVSPRINALINDWKKDGEPLNKDDIASKRITVSAGQLVVHNVDKSDSGNYTCSLTNAAGSVEASTKVTINGIAHACLSAHFARIGHLSIY